MKSFSVSDLSAGKRLDVYLAELIPGKSRASLQRWIEQGLVLVNGTSTKAGHKLRSGDRVEIHSDDNPSVPQDLLKPWNVPLTVLYQDDTLIAIDKPPHVITHPGAGNYEETVANAAVFHYPEISTIGHPMRPGIVHRLDKETSGLLLLARTEEAYLKLAAMFKDRRIEKRYRALAFGRFDVTAGRIDKALGRDPRDRKKISVRAKRSRSAVTHFKVLAQYGYAALLDVQILTGRTHQIRVHLASENHPIVGDSKYGGGNWNRFPDTGLRDRLKSARFFGLHSYSLKFQHPATGAGLYLEAPLPKLWEEVTGR